MNIPFIDLQAQRAHIGQRMNDAIQAVIESGAYVFGPQIAEFERQLSEFTGAKHAIACANGTDALQLAMMALDIGPGDAVFCPSFTFCATSEPAPILGATPVFVDIDPNTYNMDPDKLEEAVEAVKKEGELTPKSIIAVCLFGQPADYPRISAIAEKHGLSLIADSAQGCGGTIDGKHPNHWADITTTSFFPAKPLGCYGDGGAIYTDNDAIADVILSLRMHGQASPSDMAERNFSEPAKYLNTRIGVNSRLDTIQAAVLLEKLRIFPEEIEKRNQIAGRYAQALGNIVETTPQVKDGYRSVWAQYTIEITNRKEFQAHLREQGVPTAVYYPIPLHKQPCYEGVARHYSPLSISDEKAERVVSLPMHAYLSENTQRRIIDAICSFSY